MFDKQTEKGVSPVIGVILMVAVTVALVALVTVVVFDLGGDVSDSPDATVELEQTDSGVEATLLRNENVEYLYFDSETDPGGAGSANFVNPGDTFETTSVSDGDTVNMIAVLPDGSQEVLTSTEYQT